MDDLRAHIVALSDTRNRVWNEARHFLDDCQRRHPGIEFNAEERVQWERYNERMNDLEATVKSLEDRERREQEAGTLREAFERQHGSIGAEQRIANDTDEFRAFLRGETRGNGADWEQRNRPTFGVNLAAAARAADMIRQGADAKELRALLWDTGSIASAVPTLLSQTLYGYLEAGIAAFRMGTTKIQTANGDSIQFPALAAHAIATQVKAQGTALAGTDPTFTRMQLDAFKYGELVQVSSEVVQDAVIDVVGYVMKDVGRAVARKVDADLVAGSGSGAPQGMTTAVTVGSAGTVATGGTLITPTYENLVTLLYSVNDQYRQSQSCAWLMQDSTAGTIRKLRDGSGGTLGAPLWQPSQISGIQFGQPDRLLDYPVFIDPNVASMASNNKVIFFGDWNAYYLREIGDFVFERSDDYAFNVDEVTFRGKWRVDGDFIDLTAVNLLKQSV